MDEHAQSFIGKIATFFPDPSAVTKGMTAADAVIYAGQVTAAAFNGHKGAGKIPDFTLTVRGKTGKTATVSIYENHIQIHDLWDTAISYAKSTSQPSRTVP
jgi:methylaspartate ammonia-lyase